MSLTILVETFGTVSECQSYFTKINYNYLSDTTNLEPFLFQSFIEMNSFCDWNSNSYYYFDQTIVPDQIKYAQFELVKNMLVNGTTSSEPTTPLTQLKAGSVQFNFKVSDVDQQNSLWTENVKGLLRNQCTFNEPGQAILKVW